MLEQQLKHLNCAGFLAATLVLHGLAHAQAPSSTYPTRPVRLVVPFAAGGMVERGFLHPAHQAFGAAAVADQVGDGTEFQVVPLREGNQVRHPRHGAAPLCGHLSAHFGQYG